MEGEFKKLILIVILILNLTSTLAIDDKKIIFNGPETQYVNITITDFSIQDISFIISGKLYNGSYPSNITVDVADDGIIDWSYAPYHSNISAYGDRVVNAYSSETSSSTITITSGMDNTGFGTSLGMLTNNIFDATGEIQNNWLGLDTNDDISEQIISITTNDTTINAFVPSLSPTIGSAGLYIAKGGSTYYCHGDHTFDTTFTCNMTAAQAMVPAHLARKANNTNFTHLAKIKNPKIIDSINNELQSCSLPCNITIKITSQTAGNITLTNFSVTGPEPPANITMTENATHYNILVSPYTNLTSVEYAYGEKPFVFIIPVIGSGDNSTMDENQTIRYDYLKNNLVSAWDNLTNNSYPMNFTFFDGLQKLPDYNYLDDDYSSYSSKAQELALDLTDGVSPKIVIIIDIHDYFPDRDPYNMVTTITDDGLISQIYMNGFSDINNKTRLYRYDEELLTNIAVHELLHTFVHYTNKDNLFYGGHPASFTDINDFPTYNASDSPTGNEGYYDYYSILNQLRPYIALQDISNEKLRLSPFEMMLAGLLSPYENYNYTFYEGNITNAGNRYQATSMTPITSADAGLLYLQTRSNTDWWNIIDDSSRTDMGTSISFSVPKSEQDNRSLLVFITDENYDDHFKVFNSNSVSIKKIINYTLPLLNLAYPSDMSYITKNHASFVCEAYNNITNITLYTTTGGGWNDDYTNSSGDYINYTISDLDDGSYKWNCLACNDDGCRFNNDNYTVTITTTPPIVSSISIYEDVSTAIITWTTNEQTRTNFSYGTTSGVYTNTSSNSTLTMSHSITLSNLLLSTTYYFIIESSDYYGNTNQTIEYNFTTLGLPTISDISVSKTNETATINFTTEQSTNSSIDYGDTISLGNNNYSTSFVLSHSIILSNLLPSTKYYYNITICTNSNYCITNGILNFTTLAEDPITFIIDWTLFNKTLTTNFSNYNNSELSNISGVNFGNRYGQINYKINLALNQNRDLTSKINISKNKIYVDSSLIPEFNKSAKLTFYNVTITNVNITRDGTVCNSTYCTGFNHTNKTYYVNVTSFSEYKLIGCGDSHIDSIIGEVCDTTASCLSGYSGTAYCTNSCRTIDRNSCSLVVATPSGGGGGGGGGLPDLSPNEDDANLTVNSTNESITHPKSSIGNSTLNSIDNENFENISTLQKNNTIDEPKKIISNPYFRLVIIVLIFVYVLISILLTGVFIHKKRHKSLEHHKDDGSDVHDRLIDYIEKEKMHEMSDFDIIHNLESVGWEKDKIEDAYRELREKYDRRL